MKNLTQYLKKTMFFFTPLLVVAFGLDYMADEGLKRTDYINYKQWSRLYDEQAEADILILGNSRAACHVDPELLGRSLSTSVYNLGILGGGMQLQHHAYNLYRKHNSKKPSLIILNVDWGILTPTAEIDIERRKADFLPWCVESDWKPIIEKARYSSPEKYLPLFKYGKNFQFLQLGLYSYWGITGYGRLTTIYTYEGKYLKCEYTKFNYIVNNSVCVMDYNLSDVADFLQQCKREGIPIVAYYSPIYDDYRNDDRFQKSYLVIDSLLSAWDIPFLDYSSLPICKDTSYFRDCLHLNRRGAEWLTKRLACDIDSLERKEKIRWSR